MNIQVLRIIITMPILYLLLRKRTQKHIRILNGSNQNDGYGNGDRRDYYNIKNLVANMNVKAQRVTTMEDDSRDFCI